MPDAKDEKHPENSASPVSRREFLRYAGAGAAGAAALGCATVKAEEKAEAGGPAAGFDLEADVVAVGGGASGAVAALLAADGGAKTVLLEKGLIFGGTTAKSGGVYWIPNNRFVREKGVEEPREQTLRDMARHSYPDLFNPEDPRLGLPEHEWSLLTTLYDHGPAMVDKLTELGLSQQPAEIPFGPMPDYFDHTTENKTPRDRRIWTKKADGSFGLGDELMHQLKDALQKKGIPILLGHRVVKLLVNGKREAVGVEAATVDGKTMRVRARRAVVFGSGGFTMNKELMRSFQPGPIYGGCAVPTNEGDFVYMATALGAKLGHMSAAWRAQVVLEQALQFASTPDDVFMPPGDSMVLVNKYGRRVVNEKSNYNERTTAHFHWDSTLHEWTNQLLFMVYDRRTAELFGGRFPIPAAGTTAPYVITGNTLEELSKAIAARLADLAPKTGGVGLAPGFEKELAATVRRFDGFAKSGADEDFGRGRHLYDREWHIRIWSFPNQGTKHAVGKTKNITMHPFAAKGPYYAIVLGAGTLDTSGGPVIDASGRVLRADGSPIPGLYGAGNCIASPTARYYYGGGGTLGPAMTFAYLAGMAAAKEPVKEV